MVKHMQLKIIVHVVEEEKLSGGDCVIALNEEAEVVGRSVAII